jgi:hypothetical protein
MSQEYNTNLAARQTQINEWSYHNKMDTLFVFQILFISIIIISLLMMFAYQKIIGRAFVYYTFAILVIVDVLVIINRSMYTNQTRDTREWDKARFGGNNGLISPIGKDPAVIAKLDAVYGENGIQLSTTDKATIIASTATPSVLAERYGVSQNTICSIRTSACSK